MNKIKNTFISIVMLFPILMFAQQTIKGKVTDKPGRLPIPGGSVPEPAIAPTVPGFCGRRPVHAHVGDTARV